MPDGLNERQREAVEHAEGPLCVFAGAGSGKTRVITHRIARLVQNGVPPWRILAVTFTNKAAGEMRERLETLLAGAAGDLWAGTFHAICARLLRLHAEQIGIKRSFVIYDDQDQKAMIRRVVDAAKLDERDWPLPHVAWRINREKQENRTPEQVAVQGAADVVFRDLYASYERRMAGTGALDFGDLIHRLVRAMREDERLRTDLQRRWDHVLVDEFQDVNRVQFLLVRELSQKHRNLCVVGDDDQSIYRWRGADRRNILDFRDHFADATIVKLEQNYRSTQRILQVANALVGHNFDREPKKLWTDNAPGAKPTLLCCSDEREEAMLLVQMMRSLLDAGHARHDIALLYRVHAQSRVFEETLRRFDLPYRVIGGVRFYERAEVKDVLAYLRLVHNPDDDVSLLRVINTPTRGIGKRTVERLLEVAARQGCSVHQALLRAGEDASHASAARTRLAQFRDLVDALRDAAQQGASPLRLAQQVLDVTGYLRQLEAEDTPEADARIENLRELMGSLADFERENPEPTLESFLESVTLQTDAGGGDDGDVVTLMTIHAAKGLEFPVVMVAGLEEETFPRKGTEFDEDPDEMEEERRLAYVAFTRARERLVLSYASQRRLYGELRPRRRSRFLEEVPESELDVIGGQRTSRPTRASRPSPNTNVRPRGLTFRSQQLAFGSQQPATAPAPQRDPNESYVDRSEGDIGLERGMHVRHSTFGVGQVVGMQPGSPPRARVRFANGGTKDIVCSFLKPA